MESEYSAPIEMYKIGKNYYYRYETDDFSIRNIPVNEDEIVKLNVAIQVLKQIKLFGIADEAAEIVRKLESRYNFSVEDQREIILLEITQNTNSNEALEDIYHAILRKNVLKNCLRYSPLQNSMHLQCASIFIEGIWKCMAPRGHCQETNKIEVYEIDRMKEINISRYPYISDLFLTAEKYFDHIIGISKPTDEIQPIRLIFTKDLTQHIMLHPVHHSQQVVRQYADGMMEVSLSIIINQEFVNKLLSYGHCVKVLSPLYLAKQISDVAEKLLNFYKGR